MLPLYSSPHRIKAFADDLSVLSTDKAEHQSILSTLDTKCKELDLHLKPEKCISFAFNGSSVDKSVTFRLGTGETTNISRNPSKFLGKFLAHCPSAAYSAAGTSLTTKVQSALNNIDSSNVRGEYKTWIYSHYLAPSLHFHLAVNAIRKTTITRLQSIVNRSLKSWLGLPRCSTLAVLYHPEILDVPYLPHMAEKAKTSHLSIVLSSTDPLVQETISLLQSPEFLNREQIPPLAAETARTCSHLATNSFNPARSRTKRQREIKLRFYQRRKEHWDSKLESLSVQGQLKEITTLESETGLWKRLITCLPRGQLSFVLRASLECLPTPITLKRWKLRIDPSCHLCGSVNANAKHILNHCSVALNDGRYSWRHDQVLKHLWKSLQPLIQKEYNLFADIEGVRASDTPHATIPPSILSTSARPDLVAMSNKEKKFQILELTICTNTDKNFASARSFKHSKPNYIQLVADLKMKGYTVMFDTLEIGSLGHWSINTQNALDRFIKDTCNPQRSVTRRILQDASKISISTSQTIFFARKSTPWINPF